MTVESDYGLQKGMMIFGQSLESFLAPFANIITFEIDVTADITIGISALFGLVSFLMGSHQISQRANTSHVNHKTAFGKGVCCLHGILRLEVTH